MDVELTARFRTLEEIQGIQQVGQATFSTDDGTVSHEFQNIFREHDSTHHVFDKVVEPLLNTFVRGFNSCLMYWRTPKTSNISNTSSKPDETKALLSMVFEDAFTKLARSSENVKPMVTLEMYELCKHKVNDLLEIRDGNHKKRIGTTVPELTSRVRRVPVKTPQGALAMLKQAWLNRRFTGVNKAVSIVLLELEAVSKCTHYIHDNFLFSTKSLFAVIEIWLDRINDNLTSEEGIEHIFSALEVTSPDVAKQDKTEYGELQLASLLPTILGGNCCTSAILRFPPQPSRASIAAMLGVAKMLSTVKNYPLINTTFAEILLTKYQSRIDSLEERNQHLSKALKQISESGVPGGHHAQTVKDKIPIDVKALQEKLNEIASAKAALSTQLVDAEEEKLAVSKELVETKIENTRLREESEKTKFEITNRCLVLENEIMQSTSEADELKTKLHELNGQVAHLKTEKQELIDNHKKLRNLYMRVIRDNETEADNAHTAEQEKLEVEKRLFGTTHHYEMELRQLRSEYDVEQRELESLVSTLRKDLDRARDAVKTSQLRIAQQSIKLVQLTNRSHDLELQNDSLQLKLKSLNDEYGSKLSKYISDVARYVESQHTSQQDLNCRMAEQVDQGLKDLKTSFRTREQQLSKAAMTYKNRAEKVASRHEELLVAYRYLREQVAFKQITGLDLGQDEYHLSLQLPELESANRREISRLQEELEKVRAMATVPLPATETVEECDDKRWGELRRQLREFTLNTQRELEAERAALLSRCYIAEEQLEECHVYIDRHCTEKG
ncbi:coiled-coil domain-containing protein 78-like [Ptychodera flava]|uniref:coiled-coil domain-containing protein 78-like n=1 Tax=Ptychodera flava TaxID=63121 RepID=UPI00396A7410